MAWTNIIDRPQRQASPPPGPVLDAAPALFEASPSPASSPFRARFLRSLPTILVAALPLAVYHRMLLPGWAPASWDFVTQIYPYRHYLADSWRQGRLLPLWNPTVFWGIPFAADIQAGALYPPSLIFALLPTEQALAWSVVLHLAVASAGMYWFGRVTLRMGTPAAMVAAITFVFSGFMTYHMGHLPYVASLAWTPLLMLTIDRLMMRPRPLLIAAGAALVALELLGGGTQPAYFSLLVGAGVAVAGLWRRLSAEGPRSVVRALPAGLTSVALGLGLAGEQIFLTRDLVGESVRQSGLDPGSAASGALSLRHLLYYLLPDYSTTQWAELVGGVGTVSLLLAGLAVFLRPRSPLVRVLAAVCLVSIWAALGPRAHLWQILYSYLPGFAFFRGPGRMLFFTTLSLSLLAGLGAQVVGELRGQARRAILVVTALGGAIVGARMSGLVVGPDPGVPAPSVASRPGLILVCTITFAAGLLVLMMVELWLRPRRRRLVGLGIAGLVLADLAVAGAPSEMRHPLPAALYAQSDGVLRLVDSDSGGRYLSLARGLDRTVSGEGDPAGGLSPEDHARFVRYLAAQRSLRPNTDMSRQGLAADGYNSPLVRSRYLEFRRPLLPPDSSNSSDLATMDLTDRVWDPAWLLEAGVDTIITDPGTDPNPPGCRCLVRVAESGGLVAWRLPSGGRGRAWVESGGTVQSVTVIEDRGDTVAVSLPPSPGGRLVLADAEAPGWTAAVDGRGVAIERYHGYLRSVAVTAGADRVVFKYQPAGAAVGLWASMVAAGLTALLVLFGLAPLARRGFTRFRRGFSRLARRTGVR